MTLLALAAPVGACVTRGGEEPAPTPPRGYNFAYLAPQREAVGLIQAFDDGVHTYLEFRDPVSHVSIRAGATGSPLPFEAGERYVTLNGVYDRLVLEENQASATVVNEVAAPLVAAVPYAEPQVEPSERVADAAAASSGLAHVGVPESEQTMNAKLRVGELNREIDDLQNRIEMLTEQLALAQAAGETPNLSVRMEFNRPRFVVRFADNSDEVQIDAPLLAPLGAAARAANRIYLHGHTDAYVASDAGTALAIRRAVSVRRLLVAQDVAPERIRLFYRGAGNFIANNSTREGRAQNRRVEIELRPW